MRSDEDLVAATARGDDRAFAEFYERHLGGVLAFLRSRVPTPELALDLAAETFAAAALSAARFRGEGSAVGWLYGIARNKLLESLRRMTVEDSARRQLHMQALYVEDEDLLAVEERASCGVGEMQQHLAELPEEIRNALLARVVEEREYREIAAALCCSEQLVRQRVHRGLRRLRARMEGSS